MIKNYLFLLAVIIFAGNLHAQRRANRQSTYERNSKANTKIVLDIQSSFFETTYNAFAQKQSIYHAKFVNSDSSVSLLPLTAVHATEINLLEFDNISRRDFEILLSKLKYCVSVNTLKLTNVKISDIPISFIADMKVKTLLINGCRTISPTSMGELMVNMGMIRKLQLRDCGLYNISLLASAKNLRVIDLRDNSISAAGIYLEGLKYVDSIFLSGNNIPDAKNDLLFFKKSNIKYIETDSISSIDNTNLKRALDNKTIVFTQVKESPEQKSKSYFGVFKQNNSNLNVYSNAYLQYERLFSNQIFRITYDTLFFEDRFWDTLNNMNSAYSMSSNVNPGIFRLYKEKTVVRKYINFGFNRNQTRLESMTRATKYPRKAFYRAHPELNSFKKYTWVIEESMSSKEFRPISRMSYVDLRLKYDGAGRTFILYLKKKNGDIISLNAYPVKPKNSRKKEDLREVYAADYNRYLNALAKRVRRYDKNVIRDKNRLKISIAKNRRNAWNLLRTYMSPEERDMTEEEWMKYYYNILRYEEEALLNSYPSPMYLTRVFEKNGFSGTNFNFTDTTSRAMLKAYFTDDKDLNIPVKRLIIIDKSDLSYKIIYLNITIDPISFSFNRDNNISILVYLPDGSIGIVKGDEIDKALSSTGTPALKSAITSVEFITIRQVMSEIEL